MRFDSPQKPNYSLRVNELSREKQSLLLRCMVRGCGVLDSADIVECDPGTVLRYLAVFGEALAAAHDRLVRGFRCKRVEVDELWSYVYGKDRNRATWVAGAPEWAGDYFTWTAIDPDTKLFITRYTSKRTLKDARTVMFDLRSRLIGRVLITTDALRLYKRAIAFTFGDDADHVVIEKVLSFAVGP